MYERELETSSHRKCISFEIGFQFDELRDKRCPVCQQPLVAESPKVTAKVGNAGRKRPVNVYFFDKANWRALVSVWWNCLRMPLQLPTMAVLLQIGAWWMLCNSLLYLFAYAGLIELVVRHTPDVMLADFGAVAGAAGPDAAIFVSVMTAPLLALRCHDIVSQTSNGNAVVSGYKRFDFDGLVQAAIVLGIFWAAAIPGAMIGYSTFGILSLFGVSICCVSTAMFFPPIAVCFVLDRSFVYQTHVDKWRAWLKFHGLTVAMIGIYTAIYLAIGWRAKRAIGHLVYVTATSAEAWVPLVIVIATTVITWTGMMLLFVCLLFAYARLLGHLTQWLVHLEAQEDSQ